MNWTHTDRYSPFLESSLAGSDFHHRHCKHPTLVMGPCMDPLRVSPETEDVGLSLGAFDLKGVMDWETPEARVNCSRSSTLVRPFAGWGGLGMC